jgi:hypothetical protein
MCRRIEFLTDSGTALRHPNLDARRLGVFFFNLSPRPPKPPSCANADTETASTKHIAANELKRYLGIDLRIEPRLKNIVDVSIA